MIGRRASLLLTIASSLWISIPTASAQTFEPIFTKLYVRQTGTPVTASDTFTACDPTGMFRLVVINGPTGQGQIGTDPISSGSIFVNGIEVVQERDFNQQVTRIDRALTGIRSSNQLDVRIRSGPSGAIQVTVEAAQSCGVRITSPAPGSTLTDRIAVVRGAVPVTPQRNAGVTVNGFPGFVEGDRFIALVPIDATTTSLTVVARDFTGVLGTDTIAVTPQPPAGEQPLRLTPVPAAGVAPLTVVFSLASAIAINQLTFDADGDGTPEIQGRTLTGVSFTYSRPGIYVATLRATDLQGASHSVATIVQVSDPVALDVRLQFVWNSFKDALRSGDVARAVQFMHSDTRDRYQEQLSRLSAATLANIDQHMDAIRFVEVGFAGAQYEMLRLQDGRTFSYAVWFQLDLDGLWRLRRF